MYTQGWHQEHRGKREGHQRGTQLGHFTGAQLIGQTACQRCGQRACGSGNTKTTRHGAAKVIPFQQHDRQRRPECTKGNRQKTLSQRSPTQRRVATPEVFHGAHQCRVAQRGMNGEAGKYGPHHHADKGNACGGQLIHHSPAKGFTPHAAHGSGEQNPQQQAGHHRADCFSLFAFRREDRCGRDNILRHGGGHANQQAGEQQGMQLSSQATTQQEQRQSCTFYQDQRSAVITIAEREQKQDT